MKPASLLSIAGAAWCLQSTPAAFGQMSGNNILYTPTVSLSSMSQNPFVGEAGGIFLTTYNDWPYVNWLGYADPTGQGLANSHVVSLYYMGGQGGSTVAQVAQATVPAGTAAPLVDGYRWVQLPSTVGLWYGSWYTISAHTDGTDLWGDLISNSSSTQITWDAQYVGGEGGSSRAGRYDTAAPPANQVGTADSIYPVANMAYNLTIVPEPASLSLLGLGVAFLFGLRWKRRN